MSFRNEGTGALDSCKFTTLSSEQLTMAMVRVTDDEYMLQNHMIVDQQDDCFFKMNEYINGLKLEEQKGEEVKEEVKEEETARPKSRIAVLHSRYASRKNTVRDT